MIRRGSVLLVVAVALAGCGDDDVGAPQATAESAVAPAGAEPPVDQAGDSPQGEPATGGFGRDEYGAFVNPCAVLTEAEVAAATGLTVTGSEDQGNIGCAWYVESVDPDIIAEDAITWQPFPAEQFEFQQQAIEQGLDGGEIPGLGKAAVYVGTEALGEVWVSLDELSFRVGNQFAFGNFDARPAQEGLAAAIVRALS